MQYAKYLEAVRKTSLRGLGQTPLPAPANVVDGFINPSPTEFNNIRRKRTMLIAIGYFRQNDPSWVDHINNDAVMACNMMAAAQEQRAPLSGWDMRPEQLNWLRNDPLHQILPNAIMKASLLDIYTVSASTHRMYPENKKAAIRDIKIEMRKRCKHASVTAVPGGVQKDLLDAIVEKGWALEKQKVSPLAGTTLHCTWNINEVFDTHGKLIIGGYEDCMAQGLKLLMDGIALREAAKRFFPRSIFAAGGSSVNCETTKEFDFYASCARLGIMRAGRIVYTGEHHYDELSDRKHDNWHFGKANWDEMGSAANSFARNIARDCLFAQRVQSGAHYYKHNRCITPMGLCEIDGSAAGRPLMTSDAYGIGNADRSISPPRWSQAHSGAHPGNDWSVSNLDTVQNFVDGPIGLPWKNIPHMRCDPGALLIVPSHSHHDVSPQWLLNDGVQKRLGTSITIGEAAIVAGQDRNQEARRAQQSIWVADQETSHGFMAMAMVAFKITNETRTAAMKPLPIIWPGMEAAAIGFDADTSMAFEEGTAAGLSPVISSDLPDPAENARRINA
jgi:hypothetical protein